MDPADDPPRFKYTLYAGLAHPDGRKVNVAAGVVGRSLPTTDYPKLRAFLRSRLTVPPGWTIAKEFFWMERAAEPEVRPGFIVGPGQ